MAQPAQKKVPTGYVGGRIPRNLHYQFMSAIKAQGSTLRQELIHFAEGYVEKYNRQAKRRGDV